MRTQTQQGGASLVVLRRLARERLGIEVDAESDALLRGRGLAVTRLALLSASIDRLHRLHAVLFGERGELRHRSRVEPLELDAALEERLAFALKVMGGRRGVVMQVVTKVERLLLESAGRHGRRGTQPDA